MAFESVKDRAENGHNIFSGLAIGIDAAAHCGTLVARSGITSAALGAGFGNLYPKQNTLRAQQLSATGSLFVFKYLTEVALHPYYSSEQKRIINSQSELTGLVEASEKSGSCVTARLALEQGRDVCAVPGPVTRPLNGECHRLIRQGTVLVSRVAEVAEELGWSLARSANVTEPTRDERVLAGLSAELYQVISEQSGHCDESFAFVGSDPQQLSQCLIELQLGKFVRQVSDGYIRVL